MSDPYAMELDELMRGLRLGLAVTSPLALYRLTGLTEGGRTRRTPLWTRHMLGVREAERDRRRYGKRR